VNLPLACVAFHLSSHLFQLKFIPEISLRNLINVMCTRIRKHHFGSISERRSTECSFESKNSLCKKREMIGDASKRFGIVSPGLNCASSRCSRAASKTWDGNRGESNRASFATDRGLPVSSRERRAPRAVAFSRRASGRNLVTARSFNRFGHRMIFV